MKKIKKILIISLILSFFTFNFKCESVTVKGYTVSTAECVMEVSSGRVLYSHNLNEQLPIASTTKILTAITVIENFDLNKTVTVPKSAVGIEGSSIYLREGEKLTVKELLYGLMLRSGNDTAECLAQTLTNSRQEFIALMNKTAKKYGANNSNFLNPHGLHEDGHYTTAYDLCLISIRAMKNQTFKEIVSTKRVEISNDGYSYKRILVNKNKMLFNFDGANGIKTGYTKKAGRCLVSSAKRNGIEVVSVVLNSPQMWERSTELLNNALNNYKVIKVVDKIEFSDKIYKDKNGKEISLLLEKDFYYPLNNEEVEEISFKIDGKEIEKYVLNAKKVGEFQIFLKNQLIFSQKVFSIYNSK